MNVILDLDETLINTHLKRKFTSKHLKRARLFRYKTMANKYVVVARPGLSDFLDWLFAHFTVSVWTAATRAYAMFVVRHFIMDNPQRVPLYIFSSKHCTVSQEHGTSHKDLTILFHKFPRQFSPQNTIIVDDRQDVCHSQRKNSYLIPPFLFLKHKSYQDTQLKKLKRFLQKHTTVKRCCWGRKV